MSYIVTNADHIAGFPGQQVPAQRLVDRAYDAGFKGFGHNPCREGVRETADYTHASKPRNKKPPLIRRGLGAREGRLGGLLHAFGFCQRDKVQAAKLGYLVNVGVYIVTIAVTSFGPYAVTIIRHCAYSRVKLPALG